MKRNQNPRFYQKFPPIQFQYTQNQPTYEDYSFSQYRQSSQVSRPQNDMIDFFAVFDEKNSECIKKHEQALKNSHSAGTLEVIKIFESKSKEVAEKMSQTSKLLKNSLKDLEKNCLGIQSSTASRADSTLKLLWDLKSRIQLIRHSKLYESSNQKRKPPHCKKVCKKSK